MDILSDPVVIDIQHVVIAGLAAILVKVLDVLERRIQKWQDKDGGNDG